MIIKQFNVDKVKPINICWTKHQFLGYQWEKASKKLPEEGKNLHIKRLLQFIQEKPFVLLVYVKYMSICQPNMHPATSNFFFNSQHLTFEQFFRINYNSS